MKKRKILMMLLVSMLSVSSVMPIYAAPEDETEAINEEVDDRIMPDVSLSPESTEEEIAVARYMYEEAGYTEEEIKTFIESQTTLDGIPEAITKTEKNDENNVLMSFKANVPEYFNLGAYVEVMNVSTNVIYHLNATATNAYIGRMYIPDGEYMVMECGIEDDTTLLYPMSTPDDFTAEKGSNVVLESTMTNFDEVQHEAYVRMGLIEDDEATAEEEKTAEESEVAVVPKEQLVPPWRKVEHEGEGTGRITIGGTSSGQYNYVFEITTTGKPKKGEFKYSSDGGATWSEVMVIPSSDLSLLNTQTGKKSGLTASFNTSDEFLIYDKYSFNATWEYATKSDGTMYGDGMIWIHSEEGEVYDHDYNLGVKIAQTGPLGIAKFQYTLDGEKWSEPVLIPNSGDFKIPDTILTVTFWDGYGDFVVGDTWLSEIKGEKSPTNYVAVAIVFGIILIVGFFGVLVYFSRLRDKPDDYRINVYKKVEIKTRKETKTEKKSKKRGKKNEE